MSRFIPRYIAFAVGLLSLGQEILWARLVSFAYETKPQAFAIVLVMYLLGIAAGAAVGKEICRRSAYPLRMIGAVLVISAGADLGLPWAFAYLAGSSLSLPFLCAAIGITASLKGVIFPIVHHLGASDAAATKGTSFSIVYASNIAGSALGPIVVGLGLLAVATLQQAFLIVALGTASIALVALYSAGGSYRLKGALWISAPLGLAAVFLPNFLVPVIASDRSGLELVDNVIEGRSGIIHTVSDPANGDVVYGTNVYDGRINTDLRRSENGIYRAYALAVMHPDPRSVLVIGLSGGAWASAITRFPTLDRMDVVEINGDYVELIKRYDEVAGLLADSRVAIYIDDGRRWLTRKEPMQEYDLIVLNSVHHWRSGATNLLSREFMELASHHLRRDGILYVNSTDSPEVLYTASSVFPYAYKYANFVAASQADFRETWGRYSDRLWQMSDSNGKPLLSPSDEGDRLAVQGLLEVPFKGVDEVKATAGRDLEIITDDNLVTEYRYGASF